MTPKFIRLRGIGLCGMNGSVAGVVAFGCLFLSALGGARVVGNDGLMLLAAPIVTVMRRAVWIVTLMAAIMLAALTVYLKIQFDIANRDVRAFAFQIVDLDRTLRRVGPEGEPARGMLFRYAARTMKDVWPQSQPRLGPDDTHAGALFDALESAVIGVRVPEGAAREALREALPLRIAEAETEAVPRKPSAAAPMLARRRLQVHARAFRPRRARQGRR